jgi:D-alanyl-D-alanine carboxypeptidase
MGYKQPHRAPGYALAFLLAASFAGLAGAAPAPPATALPAASPAATPVTTATASPNASPTGLLASPAPMSEAALEIELTANLAAYLVAHAQGEHVSAAALTVSLRDAPQPIDLAAGTMEFDGSVPLPRQSLWQIGSNTKAFTAAMILQLEAEHKLSLNDTVGKWLPQYPAWASISIKRLLNMTSGIPTYDDVPAFRKAFAAAPRTAFSIEKLIAYSRGLPLKTGYYYSNTAYLLAQLIAEKAGKDGYADQLRRRFFEPFGLTDASYTADFTPASVTARMPAGYLAVSSVSEMSALRDKDVRDYSVSWLQGAGGIISSTGDLAKWVRALYDGKVLPPAQQAELLGVVSMKTGKPLTAPAPGDNRGFGLGVVQVTLPGGERLWLYEGGTFGYRSLYTYVPKSGAIVVVTLNSSPEGDDIGKLFQTVYATLRKAGRV